MYEIHVQDHDLGWQVRATSRDLHPLLATFALLCEDWRMGKLPTIVNVRLVLVLLQELPA